MGQIKDKREDTQQGDIYALYYQQRILGEPFRMGKKVGKAEAESPKEVEGNVIFGEESLKTSGKGGGKVFHGGLLSWGIPVLLLWRPLYTTIKLGRLQEVQLILVTYKHSVASRNVAMSFMYLHRSVGSWDSIYLV